jgi:hypothetical protein
VNFHTSTSIRAWSSASRIPSSRVIFGWQKVSSLELSQHRPGGGMVPREGFEPTTLGLKVRCSARLSYRGGGIKPTPGGRWRPQGIVWRGGFG